MTLVIAVLVGAVLVGAVSLMISGLKWLFILAAALVVASAVSDTAGRRSRLHDTRAGPRRSAGRAA